MNCHICHKEAVDRCYTCGELFCAEHGDINCRRCETGIVAGDSRTDRVSAVLLTTKSSRPGWWRPQPAEDYDPPACYECQGLARYVCADCRARYCREHAGKNGLCEQCQRSTRGGTIMLVVLFIILGSLTVLGLVQAHSQ